MNKEIIGLETDQVALFPSHCMAIMGYLPFVALGEERELPLVLSIKKDPNIRLLYFSIMQRYKTDS